MCFQFSHMSSWNCFQGWNQRLFFLSHPFLWDKKWKRVVVNSVFCKERLGELCTLKSFPGKAGVEGKAQIPLVELQACWVSFSLESGLTPVRRARWSAACPQRQGLPAIPGSTSASVPGVCESLFVELGPVERLLLQVLSFWMKRLWIQVTAAYFLPSFVCLKAEGLPAWEVIKCEP